MAKKLTDLDVSSADSGQGPSEEEQMTLTNYSRCSPQAIPFPQATYLQIIASPGSELLTKENQEMLLNSTPQGYYICTIPHTNENS
ncbi:hypothetical protein Ciccas_003871 [Cichlidogyrus casuarinus]|uniref:Uncharacterized protein n=1 Tax=Cichlidogyrus casuarinus TaxID=1844966 RepID=A0ABD2QD85_9PLAT